MNATQTSYLENNFGPSSELVDIGLFSQTKPITVDFAASSLEIATECSVNDIRDSLTEINDDPKSMAYLIRSHEAAVAALHTTSTARSRKRHVAPEVPKTSPQVISLQKELDEIALEAWKLHPSARIFVRPVKTSDQNTLNHVKTARGDDAARLSNDPCQALITVTVYNKLSWRQTHVTRSSRHVFLSSQTLGDIYDAFPCTSNELPDEILQHDRITGYGDGPPARPGCIMLIGDLAYGDGESEEDYADKLVKHLRLSQDAPGISRAATSMHDTPLSSLSLRIGEPYWLLHHGNCEHFLVIDQIRQQTPSDVILAYPLTLQIVPPLLDACRGCIKTPAIWAIVNDERLGETPCPMCGPCWTNMGKSDDDKVVVVPLPKYELGW